MSQPAQTRFWHRTAFLFTVVFLALAANGVMWSLRFPPLHPNDEPQHYLYAAKYDGQTNPDSADVPADLLAIAKLADFGPHRTEYATINLGAQRAEEIRRLIAQADDPALSTEFVPDPEEHMMRAHPSFDRYHPSLYYRITGQVMRLGHWLDMGARARLLMARFLSIVIGLAAVLLCIMLARIIWHEDWRTPLLVGLALGFQVLVTFYSTVVTNEVLAFLFFTGFLLSGATLINGKCNWKGYAGMFVFAVLALMVKITMVVSFPMALLAIMASRVNRWLRIGATFLLILFMAGSLSWLLAPMSGGESIIEDYKQTDPVPRSFPMEMFEPKRIKLHVKMAVSYWGRKIGNSVDTDAQVPAAYNIGMAGFFILSVLSGIVLLVKVSRAGEAAQIKRRILIWLMSSVALFAGMLYAIDYRFASLAGAMFMVRPQYYIPLAASQMIWMLWGVSGWFKGNGRVLTASFVVVLLGVCNVWVLMWILVPRYYGFIGWWEQCQAVAILWPIKAWAVALVDVLSVILGSGAIVLLATSAQPNRTNAHA